MTVLRKFHRAGASKGEAAHQSLFGWRCTTRVRLRIVNRAVGFSAMAAANAARAKASERQIASVS
jgi:hypothetical protein